MQRYFASQKKGDEFFLNLDDLYHITTVMRMKDNDIIEVVYDKKVYLCNLLNTNKNIKINIIEEINNKMINQLEIVLIIPLLKEGKMDLILQKATELGVNKIIPINTERSIIKLDKIKEKKKIERWSKICKEASEQSKRTDIPLITNIYNLKDINELEGNKIVCSTIEKNNNIKKYLKSNKIYDRINIVIGPEGGLSNREENQLVDMGFVKVSLGDRIMRVETVPMFILSILNYEYME